LNSLSSQRSLKAVKLLNRVVVALTAATVAACASVGPMKPEDEVKARAQARWDALVKGDTKSAYEYFSPGTRAVMDLKSYDDSIRKGFWKAATVDQVTCPAADRCEADETIEYEYKGRRTKTPLRESWIREDGKWWLVKK
jgi:hypothetical protein